MTTNSTITRQQELLERARLARSMLACCHLCEHRCGINRLAPHSAPCRAGSESYIFKKHLSLAEEAALLPSYMVYFGGCNFRCAFCIQGPTCFDTFRGIRFDAATLAADCAHMVEQGARTINLLGGEPSLHLHSILELAAASPQPLPLILNSNFYMTPQVLTLLDGVIDLYLADFKFGNDSCARRLAGVDRYVEVIQRNLLHAHRQGRLLVRHLLMPAHYDCCFVPVAQWMARHLPEVPFSLMDGYIPHFKAEGPATPELAAYVPQSDVDRAWALLRSLGLKLAP